jgi:MinD superfamily P-loop ATPase
LGIAEENSGKLVAVVRQNARSVAENGNLEYIITDGPPGIGCPVISSLSGATLALLITEPTLSGIHDLERVIGVCRHFGVPALVCINKYDINEDNTRRIERFCQGQGVDMVSKIPVDNAVTEAMVSGVPVVEYCQNGVSREIEKLWGAISSRLSE